MAREARARFLLARTGRSLTTKTRPAKCQREPDFPEINVPEPAQRLLREHLFTFEQLGPASLFA